MNPAEVAPILEALRSMPAWLKERAAKIPQASIRTQPKEGGFSFLENVWHLADFERDGFGARLGRVLAEERPHLIDFNGEKIARERKYLERDLTEGLSSFESARSANLLVLENLSVDKWARGATQDGYGETTIADLPARTAEHDRSHREEIESLLEEIRLAKHR